MSGTRNQDAGRHNAGPNPQPPSGTREEDASRYNAGSIPAELSSSGTHGQDASRYNAGSIPSSSTSGTRDRGASSYNAGSNPQSPTSGTHGPDASRKTAGSNPLSASSRTHATGFFWYFVDNVNFLIPWATSCSPKTAYFNASGSDRRRYRPSPPLLRSVPFPSQPKFGNQVTQVTQAQRLEEAKDDLARTQSERALDPRTRSISGESGTGLKPSWRWCVCLELGYPLVGSKGTKVTIPSWPFSSSQLLGFTWQDFVRMLSKLHAEARNVVQSCCTHAVHGTALNKAEALRLLDTWRGNICCQHGLKQSYDPFPRENKQTHTYMFFKTTYENLGGSLLLGVAGFCLNIYIYI